MKRSSLIGRGLIVSSVLCLNACEEGLDAEKSNSSTNQAIDVPVEDLTTAGQKQAYKANKVIEPVEAIRTKEDKAEKRLAVESVARSVNDGGGWEARPELDFSLNFDQLELNRLSNGFSKQSKEPLQGIFASEEEASRVDVETHFEGPHNENKERETTPDGVGVEFRIGF